RAEHARGTRGRFAPGLPSISDGQILFLLHMLAHMKDQKDGGSRVAIIMNGSPLFTGDAGSGTSEIRRVILENDLLEAPVRQSHRLCVRRAMPASRAAAVAVRDGNHGSRLAAFAAVVVRYSREANSLAAGVGVHNVAFQRGKDVANVFAVIAKD